LAAGWTAGLTAGLLAGLLVAAIAVTVPMGAHAASESRPGRGFGPVYDAAHEVTLEGTIQEVVTKHTAGTPPGMHLLVAGPEGLIDAHVGPFVSKEMKAALVAGMPVRIVGATTLLHGKSYLLARQLTVGENTVTVRSPRGIILPPHSDIAPHRRTSKPSQTEPNGGAR